MDKQIACWIEGSEKDLPVAEIMLEKGHYTWSLFIGHLILENIKSNVCKGT